MMFVSQAFMDISGFKSLAAWAKRCQENLPGFENIVLKGCETYKKAIAHLMSV